MAAQQRQRAPAAAAACAAAALLLLLALLAPQAAALTRPDQFEKLVAFRDAMRTRSPYWAAATATWTCPTPPANSDSACDPCGRDTAGEGNWYHMHCRGNSTGWGESGNGIIDGVVTNCHITSVKVNGPVPREACVLESLREFDFGGIRGRGYLTGPMPTWLGKCFAGLEELDLSNNRLTGTLPAYIAALPALTEVKVQNNMLLGTIPNVFGRMTRGVRRFQVEYNQMSGRIPQTFKLSADAIAEFHIANNDFEGDLSALAGSHLSTVTVHENPKLCGMVPSSVRYAKGYNPAGTALGQPCPA